MLQLSSSIVERLFPGQPLSGDEQLALQAPLEECLVKWGAPTTPGGRLALTAAAIFLGRYLVYKLNQVEPPSTVGDMPAPPATPPAGKQTVESSIVKAAAA